MEMGSLAAFLQGCDGAPAVISGAEAEAIRAISFCGNVRGALHPTSSNQAFLLSDCVSILQVWCPGARAPAPLVPGAKCLE